MFGLFRKRQVAEPNQSVALVAPNQVELAGKSWPVSSFWQAHENLLVTDHNAIQQWLSALPSAQQFQAQQTLLQHYLLHWRATLGPNYQLLQETGACLVSSLKPDLAKQALAMLTRPQKRIHAILGGLLDAQPQLPEVLLVFEHEAEALAHLQHHGQQQHYRVDGLLPHFVASNQQLFQLEGWIANYLLQTHLLKLQLPRWLHEGIVANVQRKISSCQSSCRCGPPQLHQQHLAYWTPERIQLFWAGSLFDEAEPHGVMAYDLARILVEVLAENWENFIRFARSAELTDAGNQAAVQHLEIELGRLSCAALEMDYQEEWSPCSTAVLVSD